MYKFFGDPLKIINSKTSNKPLFRFDTKGEFITDDNEIIQRAIGHFDHIEMKVETVGKRVKKTIFTPAISITTKLDNIEIKNLTESFNEEEVRLKAKEKGIKNWHNKKISNLIEELKEE